MPATCHGVCLAFAWLVWAAAGMVPAWSLAQDEPRHVSAAARAFIAKGVAHVLTGCSDPMPPKRCPHGRRLKASPVQTLPDSNGGPPFTFQTIAYAGMTMTYRAGDVVELTVSSPAWPVLHNLRVGAPFSRVSARLGEPMALQDGATAAEQIALYCRNEDCATFSIDRRAGRVTSITWSFYYD